MWVVLAILKWIGIGICVVLGLLILLLALAVFVPVRYRLYADTEDEFRYAFRVSWLLSILAVKKNISSDEVRLCLFGIPVRNITGSEKEKDKAPKGKNTKEKNAENTRKKKQDSKENKETPKKEKKEVKQAGKQKGKKEAVKDDKRKKKSGKKGFSFEKLSSIMRLVKENRMVLKRIFREVGGLLRYLFPRKICGEVVLGTGDPSTTGLVFGGLSLFPAVYQKGLQITPDFEEKRFYAKGVVKGRIQLFYFLKLVLRLYRDSEIKRLWKQINQGKKEAA